MSDINTRVSLILAHMKGSDPWDQMNRTADTILKAYQELFPVFDSLCSKTCPTCREVCCHLVRLHFGLSDILFIHLIGSELPSWKPTTINGASCHYATPTGCSLSRLSRPYICTDYLCRPQVGLLRKQGRQQRSSVEQTLLTIREELTQLERVYLHHDPGVIKAFPSAA